MTYENFGFEVDGDGIALVTWDMPGRSMNVLSQSSMADLGDIIERIAGDDEIKGAVITSGKPAFCAGADLSMMGSTASGERAEGQSEEDKVRALYENNLQFNMLLRKLETCGKPVAAAINGTALGGGLEVTLACHYRVAADNDRIQLGLPESKVGLLPGGGGTQRLPRLIGAGAALPLILQGTSLTPAKAAKQGIVHKVVSVDGLVSEAKRWVKEEGDPEQPWDKKGYKVPGGDAHHGAGQIFTMGNAMLRKQTYNNYPAQRYIMQCVYEGIMVPIEAGIRIEARYFTKLLQDPTSKNMIRSLFLSMQELGKGARRPQGVEETRVRKLGVLGAGMMGAGIAHVSARNGMEVVLIDTDQANADKGRGHAEKQLARDVEKGRLTNEQKDEILGRIHATTDYASLDGADLVIEAVFEDREVKADVTKKAIDVIPDASIFASNTSTLPITGLAKASSNPDQFIGIHFFSPVERMNLVEVIRGEKTGDRALAVAMDYVKQIRKTPIVVNDSRGFYTSRVFGTYVREGLAMLAEGVKPALIENAGKMAGMPVGPLALNDEVSLDLSYHIAQQTKKDLGDEYREGPGEKIVAEMVERLGRLGKKVGKGFYDYPDGAKKRLWPGLAELVETTVEQPDVEELQKRFLYIQALETARCFEEGVVTDVRDADVGAILGWGFAPFTGGPLSLIDTVGAAEFARTCDRFAQAYGERFKINKLLQDMAASGETFYKRFAPETQAA